MSAEFSLRSALGIVILMGGWICSAQQVPFSCCQIQDGDQPSIKQPSLRVFLFGVCPTTLGSEPSASSSRPVPASSAPASFAASLVRAPAPKRRRTLDRSYFLLNSLHLGIAGFDIAMTQHCIADQHCREANPLMPSSLAGQLTVGIAAVGYGSIISYRLKMHRSHLWWTGPTAGILAHGAGVATGFAHR